MKIARYIYKGDFFLGSVEGNSIFPVTSSLERMGTEAPLSECRLLPPCEPSKIVCVGLNYRDHALELGMSVPEEPVIFLKPSTSVLPGGGTIECPAGSGRIDLEAELAVVVRSVARNIKAADAGKYILGYTCFNDVTARDVQKKDGQWTRSKSFDTFAPIGPWIETDIDISDLSIRSFLNGQLCQDSRTSQLICKVPELLEYISGIMTLLPGDVIATGTPPGITPVHSGDRVEVIIEGIGALVNKVGGKP